MKLSGPKTGGVMPKSTNIPEGAGKLPTDPYTLPAGLYNVSCAELIKRFVADTETLTLIHADPPWSYSGGKKSKQRGLAASHYGGLSSSEIADHLASTYAIAAPNAYLAVWVTFPKLLEFLSTHTWTVAKAGEDPKGYLGEWRYVSGGAWVKSGIPTDFSAPGVGYHWTGDAEMLLLYKKGSPRTRTNATNGWVEPRRGHSWKPLRTLRMLVEACTGYGGAVLDLYAGDSGDLARICSALGRDYFGAELDPKRFREAQLKIAQGELPGMELIPKSSPRKKTELIQPSFLDEDGIGA